jgi:hypothetical protein
VSKVRSDPFKEDEESYANFKNPFPMSVKAMQNIFSYAGIAEDARAACCALPLGSFKGWNRISGGSLGGRVF